MKNCLVLLISVCSIPALGQDAILLDGQVMGNWSRGKVQLHCVGKGADKPAALRQGFLGCLAWYVEKKLLHSKEEREVFRAKRPGLFKRYKQFIELPKNEKALGHPISGNLYSFKFQAILDKQKLKTRLTELGILQKLACDPIVVIRSHGEIAKSKHARTIRTEIESALIELGARILPKRSMADLVLTFDADRTEKTTSLAFAVSIKAQDPAGHRLIAAERIQSAPRTTFVAGEETAALLDATCDALEGMESRLTGHFKSMSCKTAKSTKSLEAGASVVSIKAAGQRKKNRYEKLASGEIDSALTNLGFKVATGKKVDLVLMFGVDCQSKQSSVACSVWISVMSSATGQVVAAGQGLSGSYSSAMPGSNSKAVQEAVQKALPCVEGRLKALVSRGTGR